MILSLRSYDFFEIFMKGKRWWKSYLEEESGSVLRRPGRRGKRRRRCWACSVVIFTFSATLGFDDDFFALKTLLKFTSLSLLFVGLPLKIFPFSVALNLPFNACAAYFVCYVLPILYAMCWTPVMLIVWGFCVAYCSLSSSTVLLPCDLPVKKLLLRLALNVATVETLRFD